MRIRKLFRLLYTTNLYFLDKIRLSIKILNHPDNIKGMGIDSYWRNYE